MPSRCDDNALLRYVLKLFTEEEAAEVRLHLTECLSCVAYLRTFEAAEDDLPSAAGPSTAVDELLSRPPDRWERLYAGERNRYATPAAVQALIQACETALESQEFDQALILSSLLTDSADSLPMTFASRTLQALAWTRRATALLRRGRLPEALAAVGSAGQRADDIPAADYERALIAFTAADILRELGRTDEALRDIRDAANVFASYNDKRRHASAREMEAAVLFRIGEYQSAADIFLSLIDEGSADLIVHARLAANAAHCFVKLGQYNRALPLFEIAEHAFSESGHPAYVARIAWGRARATRSAGHEDAALLALRDVFDRFAKLKSHPEFVRVGIELVEWLLPRDEFAEVRNICAHVHKHAMSAGMQFQAVEALAYLREAALSDRLTADRAQYVRAFIEGLSSSPNGEFRQPA